MPQKTAVFTLGCFDILHVGHINIFQNARGICDKLIVGVCSDKYIDEHNQKRPF